jgi:hypothetical protein
LNALLTRNAQFEYIQTRVLGFLKKRQPIVSIDTKKKELVGEFKNGGQEWQPQGEPEKVKVHDFPDKKLGKAACTFRENLSVRRSVNQDG